VRHGAIVAQKPKLLPNPLDTETGALRRSPYRLAALISHPIQYQAPLYRVLAARPEVDLTVYFCSDWGAQDYTDPGFGTRFKWDIPLLEGYKYRFLRNWSLCPAADRFWGVINPGIIDALFRQKFDAVIIHGYALAAYWLGYIGAWLSRTPVFFRGETVLRPNRPWYIRVGKRLLLSFLFKRTAAFLTIGSRSRQFYNAFEVPDSRIFFTPYMVDNIFFTENSTKWKMKQTELKASVGLGERPVVLFVGKLVERKRPVDLLHAYEGLHNKAGLIFVGNGSLRLQLEREVRERGLSQVIFAGFKNQSELPKYYAMADIFVLPSSSEEVSPLVINEAMCCGLPIVVSDAVPSAVDFVRDGYNGYIYPCGEVNKLSEILRKLIIDQPLRHVMGLRSKNLIRDWDVPKAVDGILEALRLCGRKG
jgi:glycosyltransferase involved in cell wall biosynthesis